MTSVQLVEQGHAADPRRIAVGLSAVLADRWGAALLTTDVAKIVEQFRQDFSPDEEAEMLQTLARLYGPVNLERCIWACKISVVKLLEACETGIQLTISQVAQRLGVKEDEVLAEAMSPSAQKLSDNMLVAHCAQRVGSIYLAMLSQATSKGNAKAAELLLSRFDPGFRSAEDPTARDKAPDFISMNESERKAWILNMRKQLGEGTPHEQPEKPEIVDLGM